MSIFECRILTLILKTGSILLMRSPAVGCSDDLSSPHESYLGHWREVKREWKSDDGIARPFSHEELEDSPMSDHYIDRYKSWRVQPGEAPRQYAYSVKDVDLENFTFLNCDSGADEETCVRVGFSPDRTEMFVTHGTEELVVTMTHAWIDGKMHPDGKKVIQRKPVTAFLSPSHLAFIGHWIGVKDNPASKVNELYIDPSSAWFVEPGEEPR